MRAVTLLRFLGLVTTVSLIVAACGGGDKSAPTTPPAATTAPGATARPTNTSAPPPTSSPVPVPTGSMKISLASVLTYGLLSGVSIAMNRSAIDPMYDAVIGLNADAKMDEKLGLVNSWSSSADGLSWTMKTRGDVLFHDGSKATAKDIKAGNDWYGAKDGQYSNDRNFRTLLVKEIQVPDDSTAVVVFNTPAIFGLWDLFTLNTAEGGPNFLISGDYMQKVGFKEYNKAPIGSGPFRFKSDVVNQEVNYEALDKHWLYGVPRYKNLQVLIIKEDNTRMALLKSGGVEATEIPRIEATPLQKSGQYNVVGKLVSKNAWASFTGQWVETFDNGVKNPFYDRRVRQAFNLALDRDEILQTFMHGLGETTVDRDVTPGDPAYRKHAVPKQDLVKAKQLLTEAGYPNGFEMDVTFSAGTLPGLTTESPQLNEAFVGYWQKLGVKINRIPPPPSSINAANTIAQNVKLPRAGGPGWGSMIGHYKGLPPGQRVKDVLSRVTEDPEIEALMMKVGAARNLSEYITAAQAFQDMMIDKAVYMPLFQSGEIFAVKKGVGDNWNLGRSTFMYNFTGLATGKPDLVR